MNIIFLSDMDISKKFRKRLIKQHKKISQNDVYYIEKKFLIIHQKITIWPKDIIITLRNKTRISDEFSKIIDYLSPSQL